MSQTGPGRSAIVAAVVLLAAVLAGCPKQNPTPDPSRSDAGVMATPSASGRPADAPANTAANAAHGRELVATYQCNRCHEGTGHPSAPQEKHCVQCHKDIMEDRFTKGTAASMTRWKPRVKDYADAPSLEAIGKRLGRSWVEAYLLQPTDLRPHLLQSMPRLAITREDARDIAAYLVPTEAAAEPAPERADLSRGRRLLDTKGCGSCHAFTGVTPLEASPPPTMDPRQFERSFKLAPDLRYVRDRMSGARISEWLTDPKAMKSDSAMPKIALTPQEVADLTAYLLVAELAPLPTPKKVERLPVLTRKVTFKEVDEKVFHRTCWHCHSEPDYAIGDGGPGNSGGFGFKPRGLNLSDYTGIAAGFVDDKGERSSVFAKDAEGVPRLVRALISRHDEERGAMTGPVRGMPLGYPALSLEDVQLVETWIAQGRPR